MKSHVCSIVSGLVVACTTGSAAADELWRQNPIAVPGGYSSQDARNPGGLGWFSEVADNFNAEAGTRISEVVFWGGYVTPPGQEGNTEGFTIRFYTDADGHPGTRIFERDVLDTTETLYAVVFGTLGEYEYHSVLNPPLVLESSGRYWVSAVAILGRGGTVDEPQWGWVQSSNETLPHMHQWFFSPGNFVEQMNDVSFVLNGTVQDEGLPGDMNCDGLVNNFDIDPFVLAVSDAALYMAAYPNCDINNADIDDDGLVNNFDIDPFVQLLSGG